MALDMDKLNAFLGKAVVDFGATLNAALIRIGDRLGLYRVRFTPCARQNLYWFGRLALAGDARSISRMGNGVNAGEL